MDKIVHKLSSLLTDSLNYDEEQRAVVQYGLYAILQIVFIAIVIIVFGILAGCLFECCIVYLSVAVLRKSTGGAHAKTSNGCLVASIICVSLFGFGTHYITLLNYGSYICYVLSPVFFIAACLIVYKLAPVDNPNKPIKSPQKIKRLRLQSFYILIVYILLAVILFIVSFYYKRALNLLFSLSVAVFWQSLTLLKAVIK